MQIVTDYLKHKSELQQTDAHLGRLSLKKRILIVSPNGVARRIWEMAAQALKIPVHIDFITSTEYAFDLLGQKQQEGRSYDFVVLDVNSKNEQDCVQLWQKFSSPKVGFIFATNQKLQRHRFATSWIFGLPLFVSRPHSKIDCLEILSLLLKNDLFEEGEL